MYLNIVKELEEIVNFDLSVRKYIEREEIGPCIWYFTGVTERVIDIQRKSFKFQHSDAVFEHVTK